MTDLDTSPSSIRDDSICKSSLPPNKSSGDIGELKPCPFCGGMPDASSRMDEDIWTHNIVEWKGVHCSECGFGFEWPPGADPNAIVQWNTRTPDPESAAEIERLRREVEELREWKSSVLGKCKKSDRWNALHWGGDKEGWGFVHYFIGYLNTRALTAESAVAAAYENAAKIAEAMPWFVKTSRKHVRGIKGSDVASAIRAAVSKKTAESGHSPSTPPSVPSDQKCGCVRCLDAEWIARPDGFVRPSRQRMVLCQVCGNKRCPHATDHMLACTNSNEPGQVGSQYE